MTPPLSVRRLAAKLRRRLTGRRDPRQEMLRVFPEGSVGVEVGVWSGDFSRVLLKAVRPSRLHLVDPWRFESDTTYERAWYGGARVSSQDEMDAVRDSVLRRFSGRIRRGQVVVHQLPSTEAAAQFDDGALDWVYIDGNHLYDFVRADLEAYFPKVRTGGLIAGDDYGDPGWWEDGVRRAVDAFAGRADVEPVIFEAGQFVLRKTGDRLYRPATSA